MPRIPVRGGPADGLRVPRQGTLRWIDARLERGYELPGAGRALYRLVGGSYEFAGHDSRYCEGCGSVYLDGSPRKCQLCGAATAPAG